MALYFNSSLSLSPQKIFLLRSTNHASPTPQRFRFFYVSSCSFSLNERSTSGSRKKVKKSNVELCNEIKEFLVSVGLPQDHVPSTKELLEHGRNDLANIVRRRGYKLMRELLANSLETSIDGPGEDKCLVNEPEDIGQGGKVDKLDQEISLSAAIQENVVNSDGPSSDHNSINMESLGRLLLEEDLANYSGSVSQDTFSSKNISVENANSFKMEPELNCDHSVAGPIATSDMASEGEGKTLPASLIQVEGVRYEFDDENSSSSVNASILEISSKDSEFDSMGNNNDEGSMSTEPSDKLSIDEKVAKFMQEGYLKPVEDNLSGEFMEASGKERNRSYDLKICDFDNIAENKSSTAVMELSENHFGHDEANASFPLNGSATKRVPSPAKFNYPIRDSDEVGVRSIDGDLDNHLDEEIGNLENQEEIKRLKFMLHQKELELSRLKEQIEKEKITLSVLQTEAGNEISKAQKLISEKDAELQAAEESLSGLIEVLIHYTGEGDIVEVAGSFNGWHHPIKMDLEPSVSIVDLAASRKSRVWSTMLWLYPGVYEIKFIVDGQWRTDPQKESVIRGTICNNILKVER